MLHRIPFFGRLFTGPRGTPSFYSGVHQPMASDVAELDQRLGHQRADAMIRKHSPRRARLRK